ncbi:protein NRT1/ PTR FAMILY 5.5-like [Neltuma alba]|uniref:protein NRT1/ PTR FAMILY 5.5-like n=1 Tax=Neltuma alba TaxID=207710 RepID=UPI0010A595EB|nr:protein NRT1/ PTR FAMILY 5.5-like [Prosopis alba]
MKDIEGGVKRTVDSVHAAVTLFARPSPLFCLCSSLVLSCPGEDEGEEWCCHSVSLTGPCAPLVLVCVASPAAPPACVCSVRLRLPPRSARSASQKPSESSLTIIYRVFKAAIKKGKLSYPSSKQGYNNEGSDGLSEDLFYEKENGEVHLLPRHPSFLLFLDRAAMMNNSDGEEKVGKGEVCTVVQVRDAKNFYLIIPLGITLFAYNLVSASGNTYFVLQASNLSSYSIGGFDVPIMVFFAIKSLVTFAVRIIQSRYKVVRPLWSMGVGMFCLVLCCIAAWQVECRRLSLIRFLKKPNDKIPISIMILTPQYFLLGLMEGFAEGGLENFPSDRLYS